MQLIHEIVVDWSWAEMNAVIRAFNNMSVKEYMETVFKIISTQDKSKLKNLVVLLECSSHLTKTMKADVKKFFSSAQDRKVIFEILGGFFECKSWNEIVLMMKNFIIIFKFPLYDEEVKDALKSIESFKSELAPDLSECLSDEEEEDLRFEKTDQKEIFKDSPFYQVSPILRLFKT